VEKPAASPLNHHSQPSTFWRQADIKLLHLLKQIGIAEVGAYRLRSVRLLVSG